MTVELLTSWTVRLALILYVASALGQLLTRAGAPPRPWVRWCWIAGGCIFLAHVLAAFQGKHQWSHAQALQDTARQTKLLLGWEFGAGIYFSYLFALLWAADAAWWGFWPGSYARRAWTTHLLIQAYLAFIAFNGAVIFKSGPIRGLGLASSLLLAAALIFRYRPALFSEKTVEEVR